MRGRLLGKRLKELLYDCWSWSAPEAVGQLVGVVVVDVAVAGGR